MNEYHKTKWITKNFENLKGFLMLPFGIFFLFFASWNYFELGITKTGKDIGLPSIMIILTILATILINRYYSQTMGSVKTISNHRIVLIIFVIFLVFFMADYLDMVLNSQLEQPISINTILIIKHHFIRNQPNGR